MQILLFSSGLVGDLIVEQADIAVSRTGVARYTLTITAEQHFTVTLWTSRKGYIECAPPQASPTWALIRLNDTGDLEELEATSCSFHLEHLDRGLYALSLRRSDEDWGLLFRTSGYLKTRLEQH